MNRGRSVPIVVAIGSPFRHDDGLGACVATLVAAELRERSLAAEVIELDGEPSRLVDAWTDRPLAVVVDALRTGARPGSIHIVPLAGRELASDGSEAARIGTARQAPSSHALGVADAYELGRSLGRLPGHLIIAGVEGEDFSQGVGLSPRVEVAVPGLVSHIVAVVAAATGSTEPASRGPSTGGGR